MVTLKGRVAATIQSADELVLTELIFNSGFKVCPAACILAPHTLEGSSVLPRSRKLCVCMVKVKPTSALMYNGWELHAKC